MNNLLNHLKHFIGSGDQLCISESTISRNDHCYALEMVV